MEGNNLYFILRNLVAIQMCIRRYIGLSSCRVHSYSHVFLRTARGIHSAIVCIEAKMVLGL